MRGMKCSDVMTLNPTCCLADDTVDAVAQSMRRQDVGALPVVDSESARKLVGIVTDRDLALKVVAEGLDPRQTRVEGVMAHDLVTCASQDDLQRALNAMSESQLRRIPVLDDGRLVGIISQADLAMQLEKPAAVGKVLRRVSRPKQTAGTA
jgi:CBS domain-containing protein